MITLHHLENSRSQRVIWLCEELGIKYQVKRYERNPQTKRASKEFQSLHPLGKSPILEVDDLKMVESGAIFDYLLREFDKNYRLHPSYDAQDYQNYVFWLHFAEGSLMGPLSMRYMHQVVKNKVPFFIKPVTSLIFGGMEKAYLKDTIDSMFSYIEESLQLRPYLLGESISAADIMMSFPLEAAVAGRVSKDNYPKIVEYVKRLKKNPLYKKAIEIGGPYDY